MSWPQVIMVLGLSLILMTGVTVLALNDKDVADILMAVATVALVVASALGINLKHSVDQIRDISNGRLTEALDESKQARVENRKLQDQLTALAMTMPPPEQEK